jgi:hypothetical protein
MENQTQTINYKPFHKLNFSEQAISELLTEFKAGKKSSEVKAKYPQYFESRNAGIIYLVRTEMIKQGLISMSEPAARMVATKRRLQKQKARKAYKMALGAIQTPTVAPKLSTIKESVANSMLKIDFHGTIIHIEKTSNIIITKDQIVVR